MFHRMGSSKSRYFLFSELDADRMEFLPKWLFEEKPSGEVIDRDPSGHSYPEIVKQRWEVVKKKAKTRPEIARLEEVGEEDVMRIEMEIRLIQSEERTFGEIRKGDYVSIHADSKDDFVALCYGRVLDQVKPGVFLVQILGVNTKRKKFMEDVFETDGKTLFRRVDYSSEIDPGKIYAFDSSMALPQNAEFTRYLREEELTGKEWIHVPDEILDRDLWGTKFKRK